MAASTAESRYSASACRTLGVAALVVAVTIAAFWPALGAGFLNWDDDLLLIENTNWRGLTPHSFGWMLTTTYMGPYQPLAWFSYALDEQFWSLNPFAFHATNLALHAATAAIFFFLARRIIRLVVHPDGLTLDFCSAVCALLFSIHPLRVESVAWITERRDVLCGVFFVGALLAYVRAADNPASTKHAHALRPACIVLVALAALSKGWAMALPAIMLILDYYPLRRRPLTPWSRLCAEKTPVVIIAALTALIAYLGQRSMVWGPRQLDHRGIGERIAQTSFALAFYPAKTVWPARLLPIYELPETIRLAAPRFALATLGVVAITIAAWSFRLRWPALLAGWLAYLVTIAPFAGIVQFGNQIVADRYSYLSCLSFPILAAGSLTMAARAPRWRATAMVGAMAVLAVLAVQSWRLTEAWHDSFSLWRRALAIDPGSWIAHSNLGDALRKAGDASGAEQQFEAAVRTNPRAGVAWLNLGEILKAEGRIGEAEAAFIKAANYHPEPALAELQLGEVCARTARPDEALAHFFAATTNPKTAAWAEFGAGVVLTDSGHAADAVRHLRRAVALNPAIPGGIEQLNAAISLAQEQVYPASTAPYKQN